MDGISMSMKIGVTANVFFEFFVRLCPRPLL